MSFLATTRQWLEYSTLWFFLSFPLYIFYLWSPWNTILGLSKGNMAPSWKLLDKDTRLVLNSSSILRTKPLADFGAISFSQWWEEGSAIPLLKKSSQENWSYLSRQLLEVKTFLKTQNISTIYISLSVSI